MIDKPKGLEKENASKAAGLLQDVLADLVDLSLQLKQAHWNVVGQRFRSVHLQLDEIVLIVRDELDEIAERIVVLGESARGDADAVKENSGLEPFPRGPIDDKEVVSAISTRIQTLVERARTRQEQLGEVDMVSEDLVVGMLGKIEKANWMLMAQLS